MAANDQHDILLNGQGYQLVRAKSGAARAWKRTGVPNIPGSRFPDEERYTSYDMPGTVRFSEVFDDWSGGFGYAYRAPPLPYRYVPTDARAIPVPNAVHWSENFDLRFQRQAVHCQALMTATLFDDIDNDQVSGVQWMIDLPLKSPTPPVGFGGVFAYGRRQNLVTDRDSWVQYPKTGVFPPALDATFRSTTSRNGLEGPPAIFGSYMYVGGGSGNFYRFDLDGTNPTQGPIPAQGFVNAEARLWAKIGAKGLPNALMSIAAGVNASLNPNGMLAADWSATLPVGNGQRAIGDMAAIGVSASGAQVFCGLADGLYAGDQGGRFVNVTGELAGQANQDNFRDLCIHDGLVIGQHISGIYAHNPFTTALARTKQIGPVVRSNRSPVQGFDTAVESFGGWLYAAKWTGSQSWLMAGMDETGQGDYRWNLLNRIPAPGRVSRLHFDGITYASGSPAAAIPNRMWVAMEGSFGAMAVGGTVAPLYFQPIPRLNANPLAPDPVFSANYNGSARMVMPRSDRGAPGVLKMYEYAEVWADAFLSGSRYADVYYRIDDGARTLLGRAQSSPLSTLYFTISNPSFYSGRSIELDVESYDATPGTCQVYRSFVLYGALRPNSVDVIDATIHIGDNVPDRRGAPMRPGRLMIDELRSYADPQRLGGQALTLIDLAGATQQVVVVSPISETEFYQDGGRDAEIAAGVKLAVLTYSGV